MVPETPLTPAVYCSIRLDYGVRDLQGTLGASMKYRSVSWRSPMVSQQFISCVPVVETNKVRWLSYQGHVPRE